LHVSSIKSICPSSVSTDKTRPAGAAEPVKAARAALIFLVCLKG